MSSSVKIKRNFIFKLIYQIVAILVPLVTTPYLARVLGATELGNYGYTYSIMIYFGLFAVFGFNIYGRREIAKIRDDKEKTSKVFFEIMIAKSIPTIISIAIYIGLAILYKEFTILLFSSVPFLLYHLFDITFLVQGDENFKYVTLRDLLVKVVTVVLIFVLIKKPDDVWIYALITSLSQLLSALIMFTYLRKRIVRVPFKTLEIGGHLKRSMVFLVPALASSVFLYVDKIMIKLITGSSEQIAFYEESIKIVTMLTGITTSLANVIEPRNAYEIAQNRLDQAKNNITKGINYSMVICLPAMAGLMSVAPIFCPIFFGDGFEEVIPILQIMCILVPLISINEMIGTAYLIPLGKEKVYTRIILICAGINIILNFLFVYFFGAVGAAISTTIAELIKTYLILYIVRKEIKLIDIVKKLNKKILSTVIMAFIVLPMAYLSIGTLLSLIGMVLSGAIVFVGAEYLLFDDEFIVMAKYCLYPFSRVFRRVKND